MVTAAEVATIWDAVRLAERFGPISLDRICADPPPGLGTEEDVTWFDDHKDKLYELVDGVLVEKVIGTYESLLAVEIARLLGNFVRRHKLGAILGADGTLKLAPRLVRIPDVCFISKEKFPQGKYPRKAIWTVAPDLAVEVLSKGNTKKEMSDKLRDYFKTGTRLVWYVDPQRQTVRVFTDVRKSQLLSENDVLEGGNVLPGFSLPVRDLFADLP
jgi:Uma2 family endonuclease